MKIISIVVLLLCGLPAYSQTDTINKSKSVFGEKVFSIKTGYHTSDISKSSKYFDAGLIFEGGAALELDKNLFIRLSLDYWKSSTVFNITTLEPITETSTGLGITVNMYKRIPVSSFLINIGVGIGSYKINKEMKYDNSTNKYLGLRIFTGVDYKITKWFFVSSEIVYDFLFGDIEHSANFFSIRFGPSFIIP